MISVENDLPLSAYLLIWVILNVNGRIQYCILQKCSREAYTIPEEFGNSKYASHTWAKNRCLTMSQLMYDDIDLNHECRVSAGNLIP